MTYGCVTDAVLMRETTLGKHRALEVLIRRHSSGLLTFVTRLLGDRHRGEEIFQEVFLAVWTHRRQYRFPLPFKPWLYKIALNECRRELRKRRLEAEGVPAEGAPAREPAAPDAAIASETADAVARAVEQLPDRQRAVVVLRVYNGLSYAEIAEVTGRREATVRSNMHHALKALRTHLEPRLK